MDPDRFLFLGETTHREPVDRAAAATGDTPAREVGSYRLSGQSGVDQFHPLEPSESTIRSNSSTVIGLRDWTWLLAPPHPAFRG